jgi:hypothetical protein
MLARAEPERSDVREGADLVRNNRKNLLIHDLLLASPGSGAGSGRTWRRTLPPVQIPGFRSMGRRWSYGRASLQSCLNSGCSLAVPSDLACPEPSDDPRAVGCQCSLGILPGGTLVAFAGVLGSTSFLSVLFRTGGRRITVERTRGVPALDAPVLAGRESGSGSDRSCSSRSVMGGLRLSFQVDGRRAATTTNVESAAGLPSTQAPGTDRDCGYLARASDPYAVRRICRYPRCAAD